VCGAPSAWTQWQSLLCAGVTASSTTSSQKCTLSPAAALEVVFLLGKIVRHSTATADTDKRIEMCRMASWLLNCSNSSNSIAHDCEPSFPLLARALRNSSSSNNSSESSIESALSDPAAPVSAGPLFTGLLALATSLLTSANTPASVTDAAAALPLLAAAEHLAAESARSPRAVLTICCMRVHALAVLGAAAEAVSVLASYTVAGGVSLPRPLAAVEGPELQVETVAAAATTDKPLPARGYVVMQSALLNHMFLLTMYTMVAYEQCRKRESYNRPIRTATACRDRQRCRDFHFVSSLIDNDRSKTS
jgi:hypothetical protein